jgi:hypothetical protein
LAQQLLLSFTRQDVIKHIARVFGGAFERIKISFKNNRNKNLYDLQITPQICYLEKMLNDKFDNTQRRIFISDGERKNDIYVFLRIENNPVYLRTYNEKSPIYLYSENEKGIVNYAFYVNLPVELNSTDTVNSVTVSVNKYKLVGKSFNIILN